MDLSRVVSEIFNVEKYRDLEIRVTDHSRSSEPTRIDSPPMISYQHSIVTMGMYSYRFRNIRRFQSKIAQFHHPFYFVSPLKGFPLELGTGVCSQKTRMMGLPGRQRSLTISSAVWIECLNVRDTQRNRRTDRRTYRPTPGHRKDRAYA